MGNVDSCLRRNDGLDGGVTGGGTIMLYNWGVADFERGSEKVRDLPDWAIALMRWWF